MTLQWFTIEKFVDPNTMLGALVWAVVFFIVAWIASTITTRLLKRSIWVVGKLKQKVDHTVIRYVVQVKDLLIYLTAGMIYASFIPSLKALAGTVLAGAGITAIVVGFAAKSTLANLIAGLSLAIYRPIRIGDKINVEGEYGTVEDITLRHTIVCTWQNRRLIIPNSKLDEMTLVNYSIVDPRMLCTLDLGVSYDTDIDFARKLILDEVDLCPYRDKGTPEAPQVKVISHGDFSIGLRVYVWVKDVADDYSARFWLFEAIKKRFDKEGVEIPFPYRTIVYKKDLPPPQQGGNPSIE
ncbi:MAG: mechanosensitive ion channel family protein [Deltaproteobacteria bacterium]|nr:mechanosensitive ion channel family protein [Deltaproteobacteria bacterium]